MSERTPGSHMFQRKPLFQDYPTNNTNPNWSAFRLPLFNMMQLRSRTTHWRVTCSFQPIDGLVYQDYVRAKTKWLSLPNFVALILVESQPLTTGLEGFWSTETLSRSLNVVLQFIYLNELRRKGEGAVSQLAFHQCCSGSIPGSMSGSNLLVPYSAFRSFFLVAPVSPGFPSPLS